MTFTHLMMQTLNGIQQGLLLFLISAGLSIIFGILRILNIAHGAFYMLGAYLMLSLSSMLGHPMLALPIGIVIAAAIGLIIELTILQHVKRDDHAGQVIITFGILLVLDAFRSLIWGDSPQEVVLSPSWWQVVSLFDHEFGYPIYRIFLSVFSLILAGSVIYVIEATSLGAKIRAVAHSREIAAAVGINTRRIEMLAFAGGVSLAALAGMLAAPIEAVYPGVEGRILILAFVVVIIGGIGSILGALLGALLIGLADVMGQVFFPELSSMMIYATMAVVLTMRPQGLMGQEVRA